MNERYKADDKKQPTYHAKTVHTLKKPNFAGSSANITEGNSIETDQWTDIPFLQVISLEHGLNLKIETALLPEDLVEIVVVAHSRMVDDAMPNTFQLIFQKFVRRTDNLVEVRGIL